MGNLCCVLSETLTSNKKQYNGREHGGICAPTVPRGASFGPDASRKPLRWSKGRAIAEGGFGKVFAGLNLDTGEPLAIKQVVIPEYVSKKDMERIKEIEDEIVVLSRLRHPNIVRYVGTEKAKDSLNILLEYAGGGSVTSLLQKYGPFPESVIQVYTKQILLGLEYLHANDIAHRDVKGANVLVTDSGGVKLADFGASKQRAADTDSLSTAYRSLKGTPCFMAPEVIRQQGYSNRADIWSVGCTVIEMATGCPPWSEKRDSHTIMFNIVTSTGPPTLPSQLSCTGRDFLKRCFERNPAYRATAAELLQHAFLKDVGIGYLLRDFGTSGVVAPSQKKGIVVYDHCRPPSCASSHDYPYSTIGASGSQSRYGSNTRSSVISEPKPPNLLADIRGVFQKRRASMKTGDNIATSTGRENERPPVVGDGEDTQEKEPLCQYNCGAFVSIASGSAKTTGSTTGKRSVGGNPPMDSKGTIAKSNMAPVSRIRSRGSEAAMAPGIKELAAKFAAHA